MKETQKKYAIVGLSILGLGMIFSINYLVTHSQGYLDDQYLEYVPENLACHNIEGYLRYGNNDGYSSSINVEANKTTLDLYGETQASFVANDTFTFNPWRVVTPLNWVRQRDINKYRIEYINKSQITHVVELEYMKFTVNGQQTLSASEYFYHWISTDISEYFLFELGANSRNYGFAPSRVNFTNFQYNHSATATAEWETMILAHLDSTVDYDVTQTNLSISKDDSPTFQIYHKIYFLEYYPTNASLTTRYSYDFLLGELQFRPNEDRNGYFQNKSLYRHPIIFCDLNWFESANLDIQYPTMEEGHFVALDMIQSFRYANIPRKFSLLQKKFPFDY